jgi:hypothetical protein
MQPGCGGRKPVPAGCIGDFISGILPVRFSQVPSPDKTGPDSERSILPFRYGFLILLKYCVWGVNPANSKCSYTPLFPLEITPEHPLSGRLCCAQVFRPFRVPPSCPALCVPGTRHEVGKTFHVPDKYVSITIIKAAPAAAKTDAKKSTGKKA